MRSLQESCSQTDSGKIAAANEGGKSACDSYLRRWKKPQQEEAECVADPISLSMTDDQGIETPSSSRGTDVSMDFFLELIKQNHRARNFIANFAGDYSQHHHFSSNTPHQPFGLNSYTNRSPFAQHLYSRKGALTDAACQSHTVSGSNYCLDPLKPLCTDDYQDSNESFFKAAMKSQKSQMAMQSWYFRIILRRSHSVAMMRSSQTRKKLQELIIGTTRPLRKPCRFAKTKKCSNEI